MLKTPVQNLLRDFEELVLPKGRERAFQRRLSVQANIGEILSGFSCQGVEQVSSKKTKSSDAKMLTREIYTNLDPSNPVDTEPFATRDFYRIAHSSFKKLGELSRKDYALQNMVYCAGIAEAALIDTKYLKAFLILLGGRERSFPLVRASALTFSLWALNARHAQGEFAQQKQGTSVEAWRKYAVRTASNFSEYEGALIASYAHEVPSLIDATDFLLQNIQASTLLEQPRSPEAIYYIEFLRGFAKCSASAEKQFFTHLQYSFSDPVLEALVGLAILHNREGKFKQHTSKKLSGFDHADTCGHIPWSMEKIESLEDSQMACFTHAAFDIFERLPDLIPYFYEMSGNRRAGGIFRVAPSDVGHWIERYNSIIRRIEAHRGELNS